MDYSRTRRGFQGKPKNYIAFGVVGHYDLNPAVARVENGKVLVEVTLLPSGDEIIAELGMEGQGSGFGLYIPVCVGCRVVVAYPGGEEDPVIIKRITDREFPFEDEVAGVTTQGAPANPLTGSTAAPQFAFLKTPDGTLLAIESGESGDIKVKSGANIELEVDGGQAIHLNGRTHIGSGPSTPAVGASTAPAGETVPGVASVAHVPPPYVLVPGAPVPAVALPTTPNEGILRIKDAVQSDITTDPNFWAWVVALHASVAALSSAFAASNPDPPVVITSYAKTASGSTCAD